MNFISISFCLFFVLLLIIYSFIKREKSKQLLLLGASYVFYGFGSWKFLFLLFAMSVTVWYLGREIGKTDRNQRNKRLLLIIGVCICATVLCLFKYLNFFISSFTALFGVSSTSTLHIILPIGISFYTFQAISYLCDIYYGKITADCSPYQVLLYIGFFPQIVSGPIVKARDFIPQLEKEHFITKERFSYGIQLIATGLFKKIVIADRLGAGVNAVYSAPAAYNGMSLLLAAIGYSIQIYCDFSGYSDMAIGIAHILGFDLGINFNLPYMAKNPSDFWRRWHISLSSWFREYVYIPLGGNRKGKLRTYFNLFITMVLSGLWHGANWTFVVWGVLHGIASAAHKSYVDWRGKSKDSKQSHWKCIGSTIFNVVMIWLLWIPFRADSFTSALIIVKGIFTNQPGISFPYIWTMVYTVLIMGIHLYRATKHNGNGIWQPLDLTQFKNQVAFCLFLLLISVFYYAGDTAFIYANF